MTKTKKQKKRNKKLANELREWLISKEMWVDVTIYFNGKAYSTSDGEHHYYNDPENLVEYEDDPAKYVEYCNKETVTMTFEGPLYRLINCEGYRPEYAEFTGIFKKHGMYFELGYAWSLAAYEE